MAKFTTRFIRRSETQTEYYGPDWFLRNDVVNQACWMGPAEFSQTLWPRYFSEVKRRGGGWFRFQNAADTTIMYLLDGAQKFVQDGIAEVVRGGQVYIVHEGSDCIYQGGEDCGHYALRVALFGCLVRPAVCALELNHHRILEVSEPGPLIAQMRRIGTMVYARNSSSAPEISSAAYRLLTMLAGLTAQNSRVNQLPRELERIVADMHAENFRHGSIQEIASAHGMEVHAMMRLFRKHLNCSPHEYWIRQRMDMARQLLITTNFSIKEIANRLNFTNPLYFSTVFRKHFQMTPTELRRAQGGDRQRLTAISFTDDKK